VPPSEPKAGICYSLALRQATRLTTQFYDQHLAPSGLRTTQLSILVKLKHLGPTTINALAGELVMDRTTLGRNILPLQRDGLIRIQRSAVDARSKELHLTKKGAAQLGPAIARWTEAQRGFELAYGKDRAARLRSLLRDVVTSDMGATRST
jgi:DNA-binding MarR family transcriptional regulator